MKKTILGLGFLVLSLPIMAIHHLPIELDFSSPEERNKWQFKTYNDTIPTSWVIGSDPDYAYGDDYMLYVSNDGGITRAYDAGIKDYYRCLAYYPLDTLPAGTYTLTYRYRGVSSTSSTYMNVRISTSPTTYSYLYLYNTTFLGKWWETYETSYVSDGKSPCYICCTFYYGSKEKPLPNYPHPGYAIDAIQVYSSDNQPACTLVPKDLRMHRVDNDAVISWEGNASEYQLDYFLNDTTQNKHYTIDNITGLSYVIHSELIPEGSYTFRVRSICGRDTSAWAAIDYQLVYDISKHCMDYFNFDHPDVTPQYGSVSNPSRYNKTVDKGFSSIDSRHTIHNYPRDFDERTRNKLRTFPEGQPAAIRLGNWDTGSEAEDIVYTMTVTPEMSILQLRYALVMQLPGHDFSQQPHFTLEFLDSLNNLIDSCGYVDFTASADLEGWHTEHTEGETDIIWKDWTMIGLSMRDYIGRTIKVRITTKDCSEGAHFGYAYFTMSCSDSKIQGIHCGVKPDHFTVEEGFFYRWYHKYDPNHTVLGRERTFKLTNPYDTATYCVDMINMIDTSCYFTLEASSLAYIPYANGSIKYIPSNCRNYVQLSDSSGTQGVYWKADGTKVAVKSTQGADEIFWDFGTYGTSIEKNPKISIPDTGDTLHVKLYAYMENRTCQDSMIFDYVVPAIGTARTINTYYFCRGGSITHAGNVYTEETEFSDTIIGSNGCDSISTIALRFFRMDTIVCYDTLCSGASMEWYGQILTEPGEYFSTVPSLVYDCDSVYNLLHLYQQPYLNMSIDYTQQHVCADGGIIEVPFSVSTGTPRTYDILFSKIAKECGFKDRLSQFIGPMDDKLAIELSDSLQPGLYDASLVFHNLSCDSMLFPISFAVYYEADSLINQRWNDFLSVRKSAFDAYGGFTDYQWYKDDKPIAGQTGSQLYLPEEGLDTASTYSVELTRVSDGVRVRTCPYSPVIEPGTVTLTVWPTVVTSQNPAPLHIRTSHEGQANLYNQSGLHVVEWQVHKGNNQLNMPTQPGLYLLRVLTESGQQKVHKIIVK